MRATYSSIDFFFGRSELSQVVSRLYSVGDGDSFLSTLQALLNDIFESDSRSKLDEIQKAINLAYGDNPIPGTMMDALTNAWNDYSGGLNGTLNASITAEYKTETEVLGSSTDTGFVALINAGGAAVERFNYRNLEGLIE